MSYDITHPIRVLLLSDVGRYMWVDVEATNSRQIHGGLTVYQLCDGSYNYLGIVDDVHVGLNNMLIVPTTGQPLRSAKQAGNRNTRQDMAVAYEAYLRRVDQVTNKTAKLVRFELSQLYTAARLTGYENSSRIYFETQEGRVDLIHKSTSLLVKGLPYYMVTGELKHHIVIGITETPQDITNVVWLKGSATIPELVRSYRESLMDTLTNALAEHRRLELEKESELPF